jgi:hypothetical protein
VPTRGFKLLVRVKRQMAQTVVGYQQPDGASTAATRTITLIAPKL